MVRTLHFHGRGHGFKTKIPHDAWHGKKKRRRNWLNLVELSLSFLPSQHPLKFLVTYTLQNTF